jgi:hypothetical protein
MDKKNAMWVDWMLPTDEQKDLISPMGYNLVGTIRYLDDMPIGTTRTDTFWHFEWMGRLQRLAKANDVRHIFTNKGSDIEVEGYVGAHTISHDSNSFDATVYAFSDGAFKYAGVVEL